MHDLLYSAGVIIGFSYKNTPYNNKVKSYPQLSLDRFGFSYCKIGSRSPPPLANKDSDNKNICLQGAF